jgi:hypothetical protein
MTTSFCAVSPNPRNAVFGDNGGPLAVEVSDISSGKLTPTVLYDSGLMHGNVMR